MQSNESDYKGENREESKKNEKKSCSRAKKNLVRDHLLMTSAISTSIQFWSKHNPLLNVLNWHSVTPGSFGIFLKSLNNDINIVTHNFFLC